MGIQRFGRESGGYCHEHIGMGEGMGDLNHVQNAKGRAYEDLSVRIESQKQNKQ
jgi:hypothetical protein